MSRRLVGCSLLFLICLLVCFPTLKAYLAADDFGYLKLFHDKPLLDFLRLGDTSEGIWGFQLDEWRPLFGLLWRVDGALWGVNDVGYHLTNVIVHGLATCLVFLIAAEAAGSAGGTAFLAGLLFAVAPVHAEAICWVTGRTDSLPVVFYLAAVLSYLRFRASGSRLAYVLALLAMALGLLVKEILFTLPVMLCAYEILRSRREPSAGAGRARALLAVVPFFAFAALYALLRRLAVGSLGREHLLTGQAVREFLHDQPIYAVHLLTPFGTLIRDGRAAGHDLLLAGLVAGTLLACGALPFLRRPRDFRSLAPVLFFGVVWYAISILPLVVTYRTPRHLYLPSAGVAIALAFLVLPSRGAGPSPGRWAAATLLLGLYAVAFVECDAEWVAAGRASRAARAAMQRLLDTRPRGGLAILRGVPPRAPGGFGSIRMWEFALPFALQPPFSPSDPLTSTTLLESPSVYCCPLTVWWSDQRPRLQALASGPPAEGVEVTVLDWDAPHNTVTARQATITRGFLQEQLEASISGRRRAARLLDALSAGAGLGPTPLSSADAEEPPAGSRRLR
ncbi:MAG TPA: hypothetical protein VN461_16615 [Vicinamibacteria bacterium]|nr:hypothetical protein [Vicinamibacteria bacterium]